MNTAIRALAASGLCALAACLPMNPEVQGASTTSGDFATLDCVELATAEGSIRQRIASIDPATGQVFGVQTPEGRPVAEQRLILQSAAGDLARIRENRNCVESAPIVTAADGSS